MIDFLIFISTILSWVFWRWSQDCFEDDKPYAGYFMIVVSAAFGAFVLSAIF